MAFAMSIQLTIVDGGVIAIVDVTAETEKVLPGRPVLLFLAFVTFDSHSRKTDRLLWKNRVSKGSYTRSDALQSNVSRCRAVRSFRSPFSLSDFITSSLPDLTPECSLISTSQCRFQVKFLTVL